MKILILPDLTNNWSAHNRAKAIQKFIPEHDFTIRAGLNNPSGALENEHCFDLIHFNFSYGLTGYYDFIMANKHRCVITIINERSLLTGFGVDKEKYAEILMVCPWVTSVSRYIADRINLVRSDSGVRYIPNGIDEDIFPEIEAKHIIVGYSGTDKENKNVNVIQIACRELGIEFRSALYTQNSPGQRIPHEQMSSFYAGLDVFVHASLTEGFSNPVLEALACNVPVIMTRQGAWCEFIGQVLFTDPDVESLKNVLRMFCGRRMVKERFLWKNIVPKYKEVYEEAHNA